ncbi:MAG: TlpA family protein disulfide reductase [Gammaproteobacteria bacterium]|nr:TlpA family protein disulfide reductase [Gammaproteobacteria bacterium]
MKNYFNLLIFSSMLLAGFSAFAASTGELTPDCGPIIQKTNAQDFEAFRGKVVYLDFWATWCPPCRKSMPALNHLRNDLLDSGFEVVAINVDEHQQDAEQYLKKYPVDYINIFDPSAECPKVFNLEGMPTAYLIDKNGVIQDIHVGFRNGDIKKIRSKVLELLENNNEISAN